MQGVFYVVEAEVEVVGAVLEADVAEDITWALLYIMVAV